MKKIIQARIHKGQKQYVGECLDLPVVTQGTTLDEVTENLKEAIEFYLDGEDPGVWDFVAEPGVLASIELEPLVHVKT